MVIPGRNMPPERADLLGTAAFNLPEAMAVVRARDGVVEDTNAVWNRLFGYERGELSGRHMSAFAGDDEDIPGRRLRAIVDGLQREGVWRGDTQYVTKDGRTFRCSTSISQFEDGDRGPFWVIVATRPRREPT